jgi:vacuolar-type H+-ATPase subunit H
MNILGRGTDRRQDQADDLFEEGALQDVLAIESRAEGIVRDAEAEAERIVRDAQREAEAVRARAVAEADSRREGTMRQSTLQSESESGEILRQAEEQARAWAQTAEARFEQVLGLVVDLITCNRAGQA